MNTEEEIRACIDRFRSSHPQSSETRTISHCMIILAAALDRIEHTEPLTTNDEIMLTEDLCKIENAYTKERLIARLDNYKQAIISVTTDAGQPDEAREKRKELLDGIDEEINKSFELGRMLGAQESSGEK